MDYALAIRRNRDQLKTIVLALFTLAGLDAPLPLERGRRRARPVARPNRGWGRASRMIGTFFLPRSIIAAIMLVLRPAESCVRRLIVIAAHGLVLKPRNPRDFVILGHRPEDPVSAMPGGIGRTRAFKLFDPLKSFDPDSIWDVEPKWESGFDLPHYSSALVAEEPTLNATHLGQRLNSLIRALDTIPHQVRRLLRWQAKRDQLLEARKPTRLSPMRPGLPPGWRERKLHEIDDVLRECHGLAHDRLNEPPDTG